MNLEITHRPLTPEEAVPLLDYFKRTSGFNYLNFYCIFSLLILLGLCALHWGGILLVATFSAIAVISFQFFFSKDTNSAQANALLRIISESPLYFQQYVLSISDDGIRTAIPGFALNARWERIPAFYHCLSPVTPGDELLFFGVDGFPIVRKSEFANESDFYELVNVLQQKCGDCK